MEYKYKEFLKREFDVEGEMLELKRLYPEVLTSYNCQPVDKVIIFLDRSNANWEHVRNEITYCFVVTKYYKMPSKNKFGEYGTLNLINNFKYNYQNNLRNLKIVIYTKDHGNSYGK